jgi:hypothetical protein
LQAYNEVLEEHITSTFRNKACTFRNKLGYISKFWEGDLTQVEAVKTERNPVLGSGKKMTKNNPCRRHTGLSWVGMEHRKNRLIQGSNVFRKKV